MNYDKGFVVHAPTQELYKAVQEKFFRDGIFWVSGRRSLLEDGRSDRLNCIRFDPLSWDICRSDLLYYESAGYLIITAPEFLHNNRQTMFLHPKEV